MEIAPSGHTIDDWKNLDLDNENSSDWCEAIKILESRIRGRYLDPVDELIKLDQKRAAKDRRFGFTILAIDCIVIETLQAFIDGKPTGTNNMFVKFLTGRPSFSKHFNEKLARRFCDNFRNSLLHEAGTRYGGLIWSVCDLLQDKDAGMIINRTKFHEALKSEFKSYLDELRDTNNAKSRQKFRKRMNGVISKSI